MRINICKLGALVACLVLFASIGFADGGKKSPPSKATPIKEEPKEASKKEQLKPRTGVVTQTQISPKHDQEAVEIKSVRPQQTQVQPFFAPSKAGEEINWQVISSGGTDGSSSTYRLGGTVSQTGVGFGSSASYQLKAGFWEVFAVGFLRGDVNRDGVINAADIVYLINYLYIGGPAPNPLQAGDINSDGLINASDVVYLINYLYIGGPPP